MTIMVLDDRPSKHSAPRGDNRSSRHVIAITVSILSVALLVCAGVVAKNHFDQKATTSIITHTAVAGGTPAKPFSPPKSWTVKFNSTFQGDQLNPQVWGTCYP